MQQLHSLVEGIDSFFTGYYKQVFSLPRVAQIELVDVKEMLSRIIKIEHVDNPSTMSQRTQADCAHQRFIEQFGALPKVQLSLYDGKTVEDFILGHESTPRTILRLGVNLYNSMPEQESRWAYQFIRQIERTGITLKGIAAAGYLVQSILESEQAIRNPSTHRCRNLISEAQTLTQHTTITKIFEKALYLADCEDVLRREPVQERIKAYQAVMANE